MSEKHPNEDVEIIVLPGDAGMRPSASDSRKIKQLVRDKLLLTSKEPYHKVQVEVTRRSDGTPESLVAAMLRAHTYKADVVKVNFDANYNATSVENLSADP